MKQKLLGLSFLATSMLLVACATTDSDITTDNTTQNTTENTEVIHETLNIVASSFHEYDWLTQVVGEENTSFNISLLIDSGVDLHNYEPTVDDIATITSSDLFIYNGGESDTWAEDIISANPELNSINILETLGDNVQTEVLVEGMEAHDHDHDDDATEEEHDHDDDATEEEHDHDDDATEEDEHVWLSLNNASIVCEYYAEILGSLDPENADTYKANAQNYIEQLESLDLEYAEMVSTAARDTIIVTDRFPFLYLFNDYDINYYAAFSGCSAETEASFETIIFLAEKTAEYNVNYLLIIDNGLESLASTVATNSSNSDVEILVLDSMQSVTREDIDAGVTYYSIMESNLEVLRLALAE
ncbi:MAG: metal ABC transporter substrate-binding protein [Eubacteriales bacterium]